MAHLTSYAYRVLRPASCVLHAASLPDGFEDEKRGARLTTLNGLPPEFTAQSLSGRSLLGSLFLAWLQIKGMLLDFFDDVFLLDFALETLQCAFQRLTILHNHFSQVKFTSLANADSTITPQPKQKCSNHICGASVRLEERSGRQGRPSHGSG